MVKISERRGSEEDWENPIPSIRFRFPGETDEGKVTKEMHSGRDSLVEKNRTSRSFYFFFVIVFRSLLKISNERQRSLAQLLDN